MTTPTPETPEVDSEESTSTQEVTHISIDSEIATAPLHVALPERYRDTEKTSMADEPNWSDHLEKHWGF